MNRIRGMAAAIVFAGGALLSLPDTGHSTYQEPPDLLRPKHCCGGDLDGDGQTDFQCCTRDPAGCSAGPGGCVINQT